MPSLMTNANVGDNRIKNDAKPSGNLQKETAITLVTIELEKNVCFK